MPKKIARDIARQLRELGEEVIKEGARQPVELAKRAVEQILPRGWGEELGAPPSESQLSTRLIQEKKKEEEEELAFARKRIKELTPKPKEPKPVEIPEETEEQKRLAVEAEKKEAPHVPGKRPRGRPDELLRIKKRRGTGEIRTGI